MIILKAAQAIVELLLLPLLALLALAGRCRRKPVHVGMGPEPIVGHIYHKKALEQYGYTAETFVSGVYYITDQFDVRADRTLLGRYAIFSFWRCLYLFRIAVFRYRVLYFYFNGGPLGLNTMLLWRVEPYLYKLAGVRVVVLPYGSDVQEMSRSPNLLFKHVMAQDYPEHRRRRAQIARKIDLWTRHADRIVSGCEWVDYTYHWDVLVPAHFCIDTETWSPTPAGGDGAAPARAAAVGPLRVLHAPNHKAIKGTRYLVEAVDRLRHEGLTVELIIVEKKPHEAVKQIMSSVDVVVDQVIIGWYGQFAVEAMALGKPTLCYLRPDLEYLFVTAGVVAPNEIPVINCTPLTLAETLRDLSAHRERLAEIGRRSRAYAERHHSTQAIGKVFDDLNRSLGILPRAAR